MPPEAVLAENEDKFYKLDTSSNKIKHI